MAKRLERKINLRLSEEEYQYLLGKGENMSDYLRLLIKVDKRIFEEKEKTTFKLKKPTI